MSGVSSASTIPSQTVRADNRALRYARKGIFLALLSGLIFGSDGLLIEKASEISPFSDPAYWLLTPLVCAALHDFCASVAVTAYNWRTGRLQELWRSLVSKPGRHVIAGALIGAFFGMGGYMVALQLASPAYVLPITTLYPAVAAVLAVFVLKERIPLRAWFGLCLCIIGAGAISYMPPDGQTGNMFYWGLIFAAIAAVGWGAEGVLATSGMDFIEPVIALNIYYAISALLYVALLVPLVSLLAFPETGLATPLAFISSKGAPFVMLAGLCGAGSYFCWYSAMSMTGVSRAMALNISYALWGILLSAIFTEVHITTTLVVGALIIFSGMFLVIGNPKDMLNLRNCN
ncbi:DMT family transporter [Desulfovibrio sp. OttesenSCG-928-G15]|nr:DMT family transporter [Desulfovibrio sp. OttesenSCG-928-G15]